MSERVSATDLYRISSDDVTRAVADLELSGESNDFAESTRFDLLIDGRRRYPPKAVVGLAARRVFERTLGNKEFSGGESSAAFRLLWMRGFELVTKRRNVGILDATFSVGRVAEKTFLIYESKGPDRNTDYLVGLESLLCSLANIDCSLVDAVLDTEVTKDIALPGRRLFPSGYRYPLRLREVGDLMSFRRALTLSIAATGSARARGGGNPTKRIRLELSVPDELTLHELSEVLAEQRAAPFESVHEVEFRPKPPGANDEAGCRKPIDAAVVTHLHAKMQRALYESLVIRHGQENVAAEQLTASGRPADIVVKLAEDLYEMYEFKTAQSPRDCVRQALGQLLEYGYWPGSRRVKTIWVIGPSLIDATTQEYLSDLRNRFDIPVRYAAQQT